MPLDSSIPLQSMAPSPMVSLNSMLDMGSKSLSLQKNRATFDADVARNQAESSTAESNAAVGKATIGSRVQQSTAAANIATTGANNAAFDFQQKQNDTAKTALTELMDNPDINAPEGQYDPKKAVAAINMVRNYAIKNGQNADRVNVTADRMVDASPSAGGSQQVLKQLLRTMLSPQGNATIGAPSGINVTDGVNSSTINTNPMAQGGVGSTIKGTAQVAQPSVMDRESQGVDKNGNPLINVRNQDGSYGAPKSLPGNTTKPVVQFDPGYNEAQTPGLLAQADAARTSRNKAQEMHSNNKGILDAINDVIATGPTGSGFARFAGVAGTVSERAEKAASAYDTIGKLTERNALAAAAAMGNGTNAQLDAQVKANGSASYNPTALRKITMLSDALQTGVEKYTAGMEKAIAAKGYISGKIKFDEAWSQNANVDTLRYLNAVKTKNTKEQAEVLKSAGEVGSPGRLKMTQELNNLHKLSQTGAL